MAAGFPPIHWPVVLPIGVALLIKTLDGVGASGDSGFQAFRHSGYLGLAAGLVFYAITLPWLFNLVGAAAISLIFIAAAFPMLFAGVFVSMRRSYTRMPMWLLGAILWTGIEYFRSELFWLNFGWMGLGYGPIESGIFGAGASIFGSYGLSFLIFAIGAALSTSYSSSSSSSYAASQSDVDSSTRTRTSMTPSTSTRSTSRSIAALMAKVVLTVIWIILFILPTPDPQPNNPMSVRLVQTRAGEETESIKLSDPSGALSVKRRASSLDPQRSKLNAPDPQPVDVILWPEYSLLEDPTHNAKLWASLQDVARTHNAYFIFGGKEQLDRDDDKKYHNTAYVLDPSGNLVGKHYKNHPVHFMLDGVRGTEANPVQTTLGKLGVAICFDMDYPEVARKLVQQGAEVLLVPNMDPQEWGELQRRQHRLMFQMRAAECGRWLARADVAGGTSVAAPNGREVQRIQDAEPGSMDVIVGREQGRTLYIRGGWMFGPGCLLASVTLIVWTLIRRLVTRLRPANEAV